MGKFWTWICICAVGMAVLIVAVSSQTPEGSASVLVTQPPMEFPCILGDCGLVAEGMRPYEGVVWKDGQWQKVSGVAALMIYNPGRQGVESAELVVWQAGRKLVFCLSDMPPDSRCLVPEVDAQAYSREFITECGYRTIQWADDAEE